MRAKARLPQEELAETADQPALGQRLERGVNRTGRKETAVLLADALSLAGPSESCSWPPPVAKVRPRTCCLQGEAKRREPLQQPLPRRHGP